jgi:hypothetical protein
MAHDVNASGALVRIRGPWAPLALGVLTLGLYTPALYWKVNGETRDFGRARHDCELAGSSPLWSALAVTFGALLIVPAVVSIFGTVHRVQRAERLAGREPERSAIAVPWVIAVFGALAPVLLQRRLNRVWERYLVGAVPDGTLGRPSAVWADPGVQAARTPRPSHLSGRVRALVDNVFAVRAAAFGGRLAAIRGELDEPLRAVTAGRAKAGKPTLVNVLLGRRVAPTGQLETTRVPVVFRLANRETAAVVLHSADRRPLGFERGALPRKSSVRDDLGRLGHHGDSGARSSKRQTLTQLRRSP